MQSLEGNLLLYILILERVKIKNLYPLLKKLEKEEQIKPKVKEGIVKIRVEINELKREKL